MTTLISNFTTLNPHSREIEALEYYQPNINNCVVKNNDF